MSDIATLLNTLTGKDGLARKRARDELVEMGTVVVPALLPLLTNKQTYVRWEAAKALSEIGDPSIAPAMVKALEDNDPGIRWMAAEGLIKAARAGLPPLLQALTEHGESIRLREGVDHVLKILSKNENLPESVAPVLHALHGPEPAIGAAQAAKIALERLT